ncbi:tastin isoform X2 [Ascaphus truei]|uniref:tastin isoform X2 n=1 Tax=Ascaphus truei TaxID=8439 RepID=UPI003F59F8E3
MQSIRAAPMGGDKKPSINQKDSWGKGKENRMGAPASLLQVKEKQPLRENEFKHPKTSRIPVPTKTKAPPDFQKMHQAWQNQFQKGKAVSKKSCTRPCPFNLTRKGDKFRIATVTNVGHPVTASPTQKYQNAPTVEFKVDPVALASILSNAGVGSAAGGTAGKLSLAQRVPMNVSSAANSLSSCRSTMVPNFMYTAPSGPPARSDLDRMSCFSWLSAKGAEHRIPLKQKQSFAKQPPGLKELKSSKEHCVLLSQVNPVLQQMNPPSHLPGTGKLPRPISNHEITVEKPAPVNAETPEFSAKCVTAVPTEGNPERKGDPMDKTSEKQNADVGSGDFVADTQALASILANTGVTFTNCGKLSLAQRVPVQGRNMSFRGSMATRDSVIGQMTPKLAFGCVSSMSVGLKDDAVCSPCGLPKNALTPRVSSTGSARRIPVSRPSSTMMFSKLHPATLMPRQPIFPKTPKSLALERANRRLQSETSDRCSPARCTVKWADASPCLLSEALYDDDHDLEQVAVRLFVDGACPGEAENTLSIPEKKKTLKMLPSTSEPIKVAPRTGDPRPACVQSKEDPVMPENSNDRAVSGDSHALHQYHASLCTNKPSAAALTMPTPSKMHHRKTNLPLSFLAHPALQSCTLRPMGPCSLPDIARLRLQSTVTAKQRFWDTCLDEECAFYTSRGDSGSYRGCSDPVASTLKRQEDLHFIPIPPGES